MDFYNTCKDIYEIVLSIKLIFLKSDFEKLLLLSFLKSAKGGMILLKVIFKKIYQTSKLTFIFFKITFKLLKNNPKRAFNTYW